MRNHQFTDSSVSSKDCSCTQQPIWCCRWVSGWRDTVDEHNRLRVQILEDVDGTAGARPPINQHLVKAGHLQVAMQKKVREHAMQAPWLWQTAASILLLGICRCNAMNYLKACHYPQVSHKLERSFTVCQRNCQNQRIFILLRRWAHTQCYCLAEVLPQRAEGEESGFAWNSSTAMTYSLNCSKVPSIAACITHGASTTYRPHQARRQAPLRPLALAIVASSPNLPAQHLDPPGMAPDLLSSWQSIIKREARGSYSLLIASNDLAATRIPLNIVR